MLSGCNADQGDNKSENGSQKQKEIETSSHVDSKKQAEQEKVEKPEVKKEAAKEYQVNQTNWRIEPIDGANKKVALITIDDAPDKNALKMAKSLKEKNVNAIFFVNGHFLESNEKKQMLKEIHDMGFIIGNHTYSHANLNDLSEAKQKEEILKVNEMVEEITGERPRFFRAPFGENTDFSKKLAAQEKMILMNWTMGYDWDKKYQNKEALTDIMVNGPELYSGANLLMHDRDWTSEALPGIVNGLRDKGYEVVDPAKIKVD